MTKTTKNISIMYFHDQLCQVFNALMTGLSLLRQGAKVAVFFGSRGVNAIHRAKIVGPARYYKEGVMQTDMTLSF